MKRLRNYPTTDHRRSFLVCSFCFVAAFGILLIRLAYFQLWHGDFFRNLSENNRIRVTELHAPRGRILDASHRILVDNRPCFDVTVIPEEVQDYASLEKTLSGLSPLAPEVLKEKLAAIRKGIPFRSYVLWKDASWETVAYLEANRLRTPGVMIQVTQARDYLNGNLFAHSIGYMGEISSRELQRAHRSDYRIGDWVGKVGIEKYWETELRGKKGGLQVEADARGRQISLVKRKEPTPGKNLVLSLERRLQEKARAAFGEATGVAVAADPRDGRILCYLNLPAFDPNRFVGGFSREEWDDLRTNPFHPLTDRVIQGLYPLGSIFKIVVAIAALEEGLVTPQEKVFCNGRLRLGIRDFRCWRKAGHGAMDLHQAIVQSCDVYFYQIGQRLGIERIRDYAKRFGLGQRTGIPLEGEKTGLVPSPEWKRNRFGEPWYEGETLVVSIGQGALLVTPIQVVSLLSAVANGGILLRPQLVERVEYTDGKVFVDNDSQRRGEIPFSTGTAMIVRKALRGVVDAEKGTGRQARLEGVPVAGKTGTAQVVRLDDQKTPEDEIPLQERDHAWFACYAPADSPEIAVVVLVEHGGHGGETAAPIAREIMAEYFRLNGPEKTLAASSVSEDEAASDGT
jgi:penicillin-binding protein 2